MKSALETYNKLNVCNLSYVNTASLLVRDIKLLYGEVRLGEHLILVVILIFFKF